MPVDPLYHGLHGFVFPTPTVSGSVVDEPALLTITVADNGDGTGAVVTVTGTSSTATVTIYRREFDGDIGGGTWTSSGSRTGNGAVSVACDPGYYWWYASAIDGGGGLLLQSGGRRLIEGGGLSGAASQVSEPVYQPVTDGEAAVYQRILDATEARIEALDFDDLRGVHQQKWPDEEKVHFPCIILTPFGKSEQMRGGTTLRDLIAYPVLVIIASRDPQEQETQGRLLLWREKISRAFRNQRLPGVAEVETCDVEPDVVVTVDPVKFEYQSSFILLNFLAREVRGFGA